MKLAFIYKCQDTLLQLSTFNSFKGKESISDDG